MMIRFTVLLTFSIICASCIKTTPEPTPINLAKVTTNFPKFSEALILEDEHTFSYGVSSDLGLGMHSLQIIHNQVFAPYSFGTNPFKTYKYTLDGKYLQVWDHITPYWGYFEYKDGGIGYFDIDHKTIVILDTQGVKLKELQVPKDVFFKQIIYNAPYFYGFDGSAKTGYHILQYDENMQLIRKFCRANPDYKAMHYRNMTGGHLFLDRDKNMLYYTQTFDSQAHKINLETGEDITIPLNPPPFLEKIEPQPDKNTDYDIVHKALEKISPKQVYKVGNFLIRPFGKSLSRDEYIVVSDLTTQKQKAYSFDSMQNQLVVHNNRIYLLKNPSSSSFWDKHIKKYQLAPNL
jgi:hypothetical protein